MKVNLAILFLLFASIGSSAALSRRKRMRSRQSLYFNCDLEPDVGQEYGGRPVPPRSGSNGFSLSIESQPEYFIPENTYTISIMSTHPVTMRGYALAANFKGTDEPAGSFTIINQYISAYMATCPEVVTHRSPGKRQVVQFSWTAPSSADKCVEFSASVIQKGSIWFKGSHNSQELTTQICPRDATNETETNVENMKCCSCGSATYKMTFHGIWSPQTHPKDYPRYSTHWSNVIGASHSQRYTIWEVGGYASEGVKRVAEWGWPNTLEDEIRGQGDVIKSVIKTSAQWPAYQPRNVGHPLADNFNVDKEHNLVSLVSMLGPSPDWNVGITKENMCTESCGWLADKTYDLIPWDAGTDNGVTYLSPNSPTNPVKKIRYLTSTDHSHSPFYNEEGGPISPVARVVIRRLSLTGLQCGRSEDVSELIEEGVNDLQCVYSEWSEWSQCGVTCGWGIKMRTKSLRSPVEADCEAECIEKEICNGEEACEDGDTVTVCLYTNWSSWSECPQPCQPNALRFRTRELKWPSEPDHCAQPLKEMSSCLACDVMDTCMYSVWSEWMPCTSPCGVGETLRKRSIKRETLYGAPCSGELMQRSKCMTSADCTEPAPSFDIAGCTYSPWTGWMPCPAQCGVGETFRKRVLTLTSDSYCIETQMERTRCMTSQTCNVVQENDRSQGCMYTEFTDWMPCSVSCGVGLTFRKSLLKFTPVDVACDEVRMENSSCHMPPCPKSSLTEDCVYNEWGAWMPCSASCGKGTTLRKRFLRERLAFDVTCDSFEMETNRCMVPMLCPETSETPDDAVNCLVSNWSEWSKCSPCSPINNKQRLHVRSSAKGWRTRTRDRIKKSRHGGAKCPPRKEKKRCLC